MRLAFLAKYREAGLLLLRVSLGLVFLYLSAPVLIAGAAKWTRFAAPMRHFGIHAHLQWWGFAGALAQTVGGLLLVAGLFFRIGVILILVTAVLYTIAIWRIGTLSVYVSLETCLILASLLLIGPGKYSVDKN